jgi:hypothetical protein
METLTLAPGQTDARMRRLPTPTGVPWNSDTRLLLSLGSCHERLGNHTGAAERQARGLTSMGRGPRIKCVAYPPFIQFKRLARPAHRLGQSLTMRANCETVVSLSFGWTW